MGLEFPVKFPIKFHKETDEQCTMTGKYTYNCGEHSGEAEISEGVKFPICQHPECERSADWTLVKQDQEEDNQE